MVFLWFTTIFPMVFPTNKYRPLGATDLRFLRFARQWKSPLSLAGRRGTSEDLKCLVLWNHGGF